MAMKQKTRSLINLLVLAALAGGAATFAYLGVFKKQEAAKAIKEKKEKLFPDIDKKQVVGLTVTAKGDTTTISKKQNGWEISAPLATQADNPMVDALIDGFISAKSKAIVEEKASDITKYGLDKPKLRIVLRLDDGKELVLRGGEENSFDSSLYIARGDTNEVLQSEGSIKFAIDKNFFDLRDKRVLPFEDSDVQTLDVSANGTKYSLKKTGENWELTAPITDKADAQTANRILGSIRSLRALNFATDGFAAADQKKYGLAAPKAEISITTVNGTKLSATIGQASDSSDKSLAEIKKTFIFRQSANFVAEIPDSILRDLEVKIADLRDKTVLNFEKENIAKAVFDFGSESVTVERAKENIEPKADSKDAVSKKPGAPTPSGDEWKITAPIQAPARKWKLNSVLWALSSARGVNIADDNAKDMSKYGLDKPSRSVTLFDSTGKALGALQLGREDGANIFAKGLDNRRVIEIEKSKIAELPSSRADLEEPPQADGGTASK